MAFQEKITQPGQGLTGSLSGQLVLDEGRGILVLYKGGKRVLGLGLLPGSDGDYDLLIMKEGFDIEDAYTP